MLKDLIKGLKNREVTSESLLQNSLTTIQAKDPQIKAFLMTLNDQALAAAQKIDARLDKGEDLGPLAGIPIGIKDNIHIKGQITTCASKILEKFKAPFNATVIEKINASGLIPVGKLNMDEFAMGSSTERSAYQKTTNPWNTNCVPGGSSGGSAAAVSAGMVPISLGSDTGGSIRQPAAYCGVVGLKPSYGRVSRFGLVAFASSLDQIGPFSRTVEESALLLNVISGHDPKDSTSSKIDTPDFTAGLDNDINGLKIAVPKILLSDKIDQEAREATVAALDKLKDRGATWEEVEFGCFDDALAAYYILAPAEASANLERYDGVRYGLREPNTDYLRQMYKKTRGQGFGDEVIRRICLGTFVLSSGYYDAYYLKAQKVRSVVIQKFNEVFSKYDVIAMPTTPTPAFKFGAFEKDPAAMYTADIATIPVNLAGLPGISVPCGFSSDNLPLGLQLVGKRYDESTILRVGHQYQSLTDFHLQEPG